MWVSTRNPISAPPPEERIQSEYGYLVEFAQEQAALLDRFRRVGESPPSRLQWHGADAYLRDLRMIVEEIERMKAQQLTPFRLRAQSLRRRLFSWPPWPSNTLRRAG